MVYLFTVHPFNPIAILSNGSNDGDRHDGGWSEAKNVGKKYAAALFDGQTHGGG